MTSSIYPISVTGSPVGTDTDILSDITFTDDMVKPGGGGILRVYFSFTVGADATIGVYNNNNFKGNLNADNSSKISSNGYYRFDIDIEDADVINLQSSDQAITIVNFVRAHLVQFGA